MQVIFTEYKYKEPSLNINIRSKLKVYKGVGGAKTTNMFPSIFWMPNFATKK